MAAFGLDSLLPFSDEGLAAARKILKLYAPKPGESPQMFKGDYPFWAKWKAERAAEAAKAGAAIGDELSPSTEVEQVLAMAQLALSEHLSATFEHTMTERFSAFVLASIERTLAGALADLRRAEMSKHFDDADFAADTVEMLTANRNAIRAARVARGWSAEGDEAPAV